MSDFIKVRDEASQEDVYLRKSLIRRISIVDSGRTKKAEFRGSEVHAKIEMEWGKVYHLKRSEVSSLMPIINGP